MRQETTNTFDKGLNKDLNPIVTPNDVLTDCLNGTFITFNGDELSLQNDAGNTKITVPWDKRMLLEYTEGASYNSGVVIEIDKIMYRSLTDANTKPIFNEDNSLNEVYWELFDPSVKLSKGFYPLGMKEYGGVLYIISGKPGLRNKSGEYVLDEKGSPLEKDLVEFGSYPAPKFLSPIEHEPENSVVFKETSQLYKNFVLNDVYFKTGGYARFDNVEVVDLTNISTDLEENIYIIKLTHQLDNGSFDLTKDIWDKYNEYKNEYSDARHWINSSEFRYFCPNQYKGKLSMSIELNEPEEFDFSLLPYALSSDETYNIKYKVNIKNKEHSPLQIVDYNLFINGELVDNTLPVTVPIDTTIIKYSLEPVLNYDWDILPEEFKNKFSLSGYVSLEDSDISYQLIKEDSACNATTKLLETNILSLWDESDPVDLDLMPLPKTWEEDDMPVKTVFVHKDYTLTSPTKYNVLGTFDVVNGKTVIYSKNTENLDRVNTAGGPSMENRLETLLGATLVRESNFKCESFHVYIKFNIALKMISPTQIASVGGNLFSTVKTSRGTTTVTQRSYYSEDGRNFWVQAQENSDLHITLGTTLNEILPSNALVYGKTYNYGIVSTFQQVGTKVGNDQIFWSGGMAMENRDLLAYFIEKTYFKLFQQGLNSKVKEYGFASKNRGSLALKLVFSPLSDYTSAPGRFEGAEPGDLEILGSTNEHYMNLNSIFLCRCGNEDLGYIITPTVPQLLPKI